MRVVIDTGVVVSALLLPRSVPRQAFDAAASRGTLLASAATITELDEVLRRPKFDRYVPEPMRLEFFAALVLTAEDVEITEPITACRDPKDNKFLELAVSGQATHIISGDADLLTLHPFRGVGIFTPQAFLAALP
jgi:putative PIN family toxin of toxin-antitoxin system